MKKFVKALSMFCLSLLMIVPVVAVAGCSKKYTISISIEGKGIVCKQGVLGADDKMVNLVGDNAVDGGSKLEYRVSPDEGYEIDKIIVDNQETTLTAENKTDGVVLFFEDIDANHTVEVVFKKRTFTITLKCSSGTEIFKTISKEYLSVIDLNANEYGGDGNDFWYIINSSGLQISATTEDNRLTIRKDLEIITDKTVDELNAIIAGLNQQ